MPPIVSGERRLAIARSLQIVLVVLAFGFDFFHGIFLGQNQVASYPLYRTRQSFAVALSRMKTPPLHGYVAYQSVIDVFNQSGFAMFDGEDGLRLDTEGRTALLKNGRRIDEILRQGNDTAVDLERPSQLILGNEVAFSDYVYLSFRLFGTRVSSLYYFYFLLLGMSCLLFVIEYRNAPMPMFIVTLYLACLAFIQNYAQSYGEIMASLANSRLFEALSLLPAIHIFILVWRRAPPRLMRASIALVQSAILAFVVDCRVTARWQIVMIVLTAIAIVGAEAWRRSTKRHVSLQPLWSGTWAAAMTAAIFLGHMALIDVTVDRRYDNQPKYHLIWHEVLTGLLSSNVQLQRQYLGRVIGVELLSDREAYEAVDRASAGLSNSPTEWPRKLRMGDLMPGYTEYERKAGNLVAEILITHPIESFAGLFNKGLIQFRLFYGQLWVESLFETALLSALAAFAWFCTGPQIVFLQGAGAVLVVVVFSTVPPMVSPSILSVGTLVSYMVATVLVIAVFAAKVVRQAFGPSLVA